MDRRNDERDNFHPGERMAQARVGMREKMAPVGRQAIRAYMPDQQRDFFALLPFVLIGACDAAGQVWAGMLCNPPGFAHSPDPTHLRIDARVAPWDALAGMPVAGQTVGLLGIQPHTRRRNRMNGVVIECDARGFEVEVEQSFGNCPKYIQAREASFEASRATETAAPIVSDRLDAESRRIIANADAFFVASRHPAARDGSKETSQGIDVSHRGGKPGFVRIDDACLTVPDFAGNFFFNTIGNLLLEPRAGLLFVDFASGDVVQLAVESEVVWEGAEVARFEGAQRLLRFRVRACRRTVAALPLRWGEPSLSPFLERTGVW